MELVETILFLMLASRFTQCPSAFRSILAPRFLPLALTAAIFVACVAEPATTPPEPTASLPQASCRGVPVALGASLQALIDAKPPRTTFCFAQGVYQLTSTIRTGQKSPTLDLRAGAVIDGQNGDFVGIRAKDPPAEQAGMKILGGVFQHFGNASAPSWVGPLVVRANGVVEGTEFRENFNAGLAVQGTNARVSGIYTHHNGRYGLVVTAPCRGCPGPEGVIIENSEVAFNNTRQLATNGDAGGTKFGKTSGMIVRRNEVHDNYGAGLWWDGFNTNAQVYDNDIYGNWNWGIMWELSYGGARIYRNTLTNNALGGTNLFFDNVQLLISCSDATVGGIEIYQNKIDGAAYPLGLLNHNGHPTRTRNVYVHDNLITLRAVTTRVGALAANGLVELFGPSANNRFDHNTYKVPNTVGAHWAWDGNVSLTWSQWRAYGNDRNGSLEPTG